LLQFKIHGMDCAEEVTTLKREIGPVVGGEDRLVFDILNGKMAIHPSASEATPDAIIRAVAQTGMRAELWRDGPPARVESGFWKRQGRTIATALSGLMVLVGFVVHAVLAGGVWKAIGSEGLGVVQQVPLPARISYLVAVLVGLWHVLPKAWRAAKNLRPDMNLLMTVAVVGAIALGDWFEAVTVALLFSLSLTLEAWSVAHARRAVAALMELSPPVVRRKNADGSEEFVETKQAAVGARFVVMPSEKFPLDGLVLQGSSAVDQAPITGESAPVAKQPGDPVFAGTINGDGALEVECTKPASDTTLAQIIRMVAETQSRRAHSEQWVEKFARVYTPLVMGLALAFLIVPPLCLGGEWEVWFYRSLVLLVIACPCALVISTPVSVVAALAAAARQGVLIKGGVHLETPAGLQAIALDKTGTLTEGKPRVFEVIPLHGHDETELLERVAAMESRSHHPLAQAIVAFARQRGVRVRPADDFQILQGRGATAQFNGRRYWLGSHRYLEERAPESAEEHALLKSLSHGGRTVVVVGSDNHVCGFIALADAVRPGARQALQLLRHLGLRHIVMLTGDNRETAEAIAAETGVDEVHAELLPADKLAVIETLRAKYGSVAMVGDGVNDAPALGRASVGIAMGAAGSDAAIETADIALMADDLAKLPWLVRHSRRTLAVIRQNLAFSLAIKACFVILAFAGYASLWAAIAADMGVSLLVVFNALRLLAAKN
jgi:Cd2+/Zn2+-exporting ATPase